MLLFTGSHIVQASHLMGADMQYTYLGNSKYRITAKLYRDCRGIALAKPDFMVSAGTAGGSSCGTFTLDIKLKSIRDITRNCKSQPKPCDPQNTGATGEGVEEHIYDTIVDFSVAPLNNFVGKSSCGEVTFFVGQCCRNNAISTGAAGQDFWASCTINLNSLQAISATATNNSPHFSNLPIIYTCCNKPYRYNHGSVDLSEYDSMSFKMVPGLQNRSGVSVNYYAPFSARYPLSPKCSTPKVVNCTPDPKANPPQGIFFDTSTGDLVFTPVNCSEVAILAVEVTEYRKTAAGSWVWIGKARRDIQLIIKNDCSNNNPPVISGTKEIYACPGDSVCFTYTISDTTAVGQTNPDTVSVAWNKGIPGASFKIKDATAREKEVEFCWKIPANIQGQTFSFTITAEDQACPMKNTTIAGVNVYLCDRLVRVNTPKVQSLSIYPQPCAAGQPLMGLKPGMAWQIFDLSGRNIASGKGSDDLRAPLTPGIFLLRSGNASTLIEVLP